MHSFWSRTAQKCLDFHSKGQKNVCPSLDWEWRDKTTSGRIFVGSNERLLDRICCFFLPPKHNSKRKPNVVRPETQISIRDYYYYVLRNIFKIQLALTRLVQFPDSRRLPMMKNRAKTRKRRRRHERFSAFVRLTVKKWMKSHTTPEITDVERSWRWYQNVSFFFPFLNFIAAPQISLDFKLELINHLL